MVLGFVYLFSKVHLLNLGNVECRYAKEVCDAIVAKCMTGRPKTVEKAQAVFMLWVELEAVDAFLVCFNFLYILCFVFRNVIDGSLNLLCLNFYYACYEAFA